MHNQLTNNQSLEDSLKALNYSNQKLSDTMSAVRTMIQESHLVQLPNKSKLPINECYELEGLLINGNYYLINYDASITKLSRSCPEYEIEIILLAVYPKNEINAGYKIITKMEKTLYEEILTAVHIAFDDRHLSDLIEDEFEMRWETLQGV